ncbi:MAG: LytTR family transcriptional regulator [Bacteroidales bacterium]|nr:LytTR family transcriptional regulator [Bacteroidales bacterium]
MEAHSDRIIVRTYKGFRQVEIAHISHILCEDYLCTLHLINMSPITCAKSLRHFEQALAPYPFVRIHHNAMVNLDCVAEVKCKGRQRHAVMTDGTALPISVRKWPAFRDALRILIYTAQNGILTGKTDSLTKNIDTPAIHKGQRL